MSVATAVPNTVIVGASLAGLRVAEALRKLGHEGSIDVFGEELHLPYDRPPLSKGLLTGAQTSEEIQFRPSSELADRGIRVHTGVGATSLDSSRKIVCIGDQEVSYDALVIATGARARSLGGAPPLAGVHTIRTLDDALRIRRAFESARNLVVVGAGFIGAEVAASARTLGLEVTIVEALANPLARAVGEDVGAACASLHNEHGTKLLCGVGVERLEGDSRVEAVVLTDGTKIAADVVVVGIGVIPNVEWLATSGLDTSNGVICDQHLAAGPEGVYALGDLASWPNPRYGEVMRIEHWTTTVEQAVVVAHNILNPHELRACDPVPYFWSDQYGHRIQFAGRSGSEEVVEVDHPTARYLALYRRADQMIGALAIDGTQALMQLRGRMITNNTDWADSLTFARAG